MAKQSVMSVATVATLILLLHLQLRLAGEKSVVPYRQCSAGRTWAA